MHNYIVACTHKLPTLFEQKTVSSVQNLSFCAGKLELDLNSPYFPARGDLKIMRDDIVVTIIAIKELFAELGYSDERIENMPLFVANGAFVDQPEKHLNRIPQIYASFTPGMTTEDKMEKMYRMSPPLLALETLTNSSMSFIAQYTGMKGQNTTFGNTSMATYQALSQALVELNLNPFLPLMVSAANCGDTYSYLTNSGVIGVQEDWRESAAVANLILVQSNEVPQAAKCKLTVLKSSSKIPDLETQITERKWNELMPDTMADFLLFSGAYSRKENDLDEAFCQTLNSNTFSLFTHFGNLGAANSAIGITKGIDLLNEGYQVIDIIDRDLYGRESLIRIEAC